MVKKLEAKSIEQLLAEADELMRRIDSDAIKNMKAEHRLPFEKHAQNLERIKLEIQARADKKAGAEIGSGAEGMHEAIQDIVKAMQDLAKYLS